MVGSTDEASFGCSAANRVCSSGLPAPRSTCTLVHHAATLHVLVSSKQKKEWLRHVAKLHPGGLSEHCKTMEERGGWGWDVTAGLWGPVYSLEEWSTDSWATGLLGGGHQKIPWLVYLLTPANLPFLFSMWNISYSTGWQNKEYRRSDSIYEGEHLLGASFLGTQKST